MTKKNKKVLVTGGSGYIGLVLIDKLVEKGFHVRALDINPLANTKKGIDFILGDVKNVSSRVLMDVSSVIHLAGVSSDTSANRDAQETWKINTLATATLAKKAKMAGVKRFIFASSASIYDYGLQDEKGLQNEDADVYPSGHYSISKHQAEIELLKLVDKDFCVTILRKGTVYGYSPKMRWDLVINAMAKSAIQEGIIRVFSEGKQWRPLISITDAIEAYSLMLLAPSKTISGQIFNVAYNNFLVKDIADIVQQVLLKQFHINSSIGFFEPNKKARSYRISSEKAKKILGFKPKESIEKEVIRIVNHEFKNIIIPTTI